MPTQKQKAMIQVNEFNLKVGDRIIFTNRFNWRFDKVVTKVSEKSCYTNGHRESWNTVNSLIRDLNAEIIRTK